MILISLILTIIFLLVCSLPTVMGYNGKLTCAVQSRKIKKNKHFPHPCREPLISSLHSPSFSVPPPACPLSQAGHLSCSSAAQAGVQTGQSWFILARQCATNPWTIESSSMKSPVTDFRLWRRNVTSPVCGHYTCRRWRRALTMAMSSSLFHRQLSVKVVSVRKWKRPLLHTLFCISFVTN